MSDIEITYDGAPLAADVPPTKISVPQRAELGTQSNGGISPEDPAASLNLTGWRPIHIDELDCSQPRLFTGYVFDRNVGRSFGQTQFVGPDARIHDTTITDLNAVFQLRIISGADGNRPSETMDARMAWILGSDYLAGSAGTLIEDTGHVLTGLTRPMDASDYRGSYPGDVLNDLANRSQDAFNWFAFWDPSPTTGSPRPALFFDYVGAAVMDCTLSISNVLGDLSPTCFAPITESRLERTPETVYSDVIVEYKGGGQVVRHAPATEIAHIKRGTKISRPYTGQASTAESQGDDYLAAHSVETDRITTTIHVPARVVGLLWAGQRMQDRFSHLPGYETAVWMRIVASNPRAVDDLAQWYDVDLELVAPKPAATTPLYAGLTRHRSGFYGCPTVPYYPDVPVLVGWVWTGDVPPAGDVVHAKVGFVEYVELDPASACHYQGFTLTADAVLDFDIVGGGAGVSAIGATAQIHLMKNGTAIASSAVWTDTVGGYRDFSLALTPTGITAVAGDIFTITVVLSSTWAGFEYWAAQPGDHWVGTHFEISGTSTGVLTTGGIIPTVNSTITNTAPTATSDSAHGYATGSTWLDTSTGDQYVLTDDTAGAATWVSTTAVSVFSFATSDGTTTVDPTTSLTFVGATLADLGGGVAELTFTGGHVYAPLTASDGSGGWVFVFTPTGDCIMV